MVTARPADSKAGEAKLVAYTDENGRYTMNLPPGDWDIQVEAFGFTPVRARIKMQNEPISKGWTLDMPKFGQPTASAPEKPSAPAAAILQNEPKTPAATPEKPSVSTPSPRERRRPDGQGSGPGGRGRGQQQAGQTPAGPGGRGRGGPPQGPGFQNAQVTATQDGQQALADAANMTAGAAGLTGTEEADESFIVGGSTSGGLGASSDQEAMRQRMLAMGPGGRGGPGGPGGLGGPNGDGPGGNGQLGLPPGMSVPGSDGIGLGGLGANAINGGFGPGPGGLGGDQPGGPRLGGGPGGRGGPRGGRFVGWGRGGGAG